jgi:hypothetical protein
VLTPDSTPQIFFSAEYGSLVIGGLYWIVISASTADNSNHPNFSYQNTDVYASGTLQRFNTTDSWDPVTGDLYFKTIQGKAGQVPIADSSGDVFGAKKPTISVYTGGTPIGSSTSQFDITNPSGSIFRYTWDGTGTDPSITAIAYPVGSTIVFSAEGFNAANNGAFIVIGSGANYIEVFNAAGVAETNKLIGSGAITAGNTWTKPDGLKYVVVELVGAGGSGGTNNGEGTGGGGGGGYSRKIITASSLFHLEPVGVGKGGGSPTSGDNGVAGGSSYFGAHCSATGGSGGEGGSSSGAAGGGVGGVGTGGDVNARGGGGTGGGTDAGSASSISAPGAGGSSYFGGGAQAPGTGDAGINGGAYGGGGSGHGSSSQGLGADGVVIVTSYY